MLYDEKYIKFIQNKGNEGSAGPSSGSATSNLHLISKAKSSSKLQYECIKSGLKDDYDRRMNILKKKLSKKAE